MKKSQMLKPAILSLAFLSVLSGAAVSPALGRIQQAFPDASELTIQMILTLTPLFIIPFSLLSGRLSLTYSKRRILFVGLGIYLLAGFGGGLMNSMTSLLVMRALLGVGTGLISALSLTLIADFYQGEERSSTMGLSSAVGTMGGVVLTLLAGWLAQISWRLAFGVYLVSLIALLLVIFFLPEPPKTEKIQASGPEKLPVGVYGLGFLMVLLMIAFYLLPTRIALFLQDTGIGDAGQSGVSIATMNTSAFLVGLFFGWLRKRLKSYFTLLGIISLGIGLLALVYVQTYSLVLVALFVSGLGIGILMPTLFLSTANQVTSELNGPAMAVINSSIYLGQFISPLAFNLLEKTFAFQSIRDYFLTGGWLTLIAAGVFAIWMFTRKPSKANQKIS